jgi:hypothetical protein
MARFLIEQGADPNAYGTYTPLHVAVLWGHRGCAG